MYRQLEIARDREIMGGWPQELLTVEVGEHSQVPG